jgi:hypothetical protein
MLTVAVLLVALAVAGTANEIRFQGCVAKQDRQRLINVTAKRQLLAPPQCHRLPFRH